MQDPISYHRWRENRFVFFAMLLFAALNGLFATVAYDADDLVTSMLLAATGLVTFAGIATQIVRGVTTGTRLFYVTCGFIVFVYLVLGGGHHAAGLFGALALTPGFVMVGGWRLGGLSLLVLNLLTTAVFYLDLYLTSSAVLPTASEVHFLMTFCGLTLFSVGAGYTWQTSVEQLARENREISALAYRDPLTALPNRRAMEDLLDQRWEEYKRGGQGFAILLCDVDHLKRLNDQFGGDFGDGVLIRVANVLGRSVRSQDVIARWGDDEFLILLPGETHLSALKVGERIRRRVAAVELAMRNESVAITVSVGVSGVESALDAQDLVTVADAGLFQAKHMGRDRVQLG